MDGSNATTVTLASLIQDEAIPMDQVRSKGYGCMMNLVQALIGVVPTCDSYLEIWSTGFRTYNLIIPNLLNLPFTLITTSKDLKADLGLALYASSRAAECAYCAVHCCSYALRRGTDEKAFRSYRGRSPRQDAVWHMAQVLSTPLEAADSMKEERRQKVKALQEFYSKQEIEQLAFGVAMMGFLNKFMDAMGIPLEPELFRDTAWLLSETGWSAGQHDLNGELQKTHGTENNDAPASSAPPTDSVSTYARIALNLPGAILLERSWLKGLPSDAASGRSYLKDNFHYDEPLITQFRLTRRVWRSALAAILRENLDPKQTAIGIGRKALAGLVFATVAGNDKLQKQATVLAEAYNVDATAIGDVREMAATLDPATMERASSELKGELDDKYVATVLLAGASASSPAQVTPELARCVRESLSAAEIVEVVVWISIQQLLHRLDIFVGCCGDEDQTEND
mmetsp:Transcript_4280/g.7136  ORF Transcript_4280/g.7136 Transcript_4280/m.7136 type:complete len:455 (+) Transcript_4280:125-1489(+)